MLPTSAASFAAAVCYLVLSGLGCHMSSDIQCSILGAALVWGITGDAALSRELREIPYSSTQRTGTKNTF